MKGDFLMLMMTGASLLVVPLAVVLGTGEGLGMDRPLPPSSPSAVVGEMEKETVTEESSSSRQLSAAETSDGTAASAVLGDLPAYQSEVTAFYILDESTGEVLEVPVEDYVRGAIAAEMPVDYHIEALKAQGTAALSYALWHHLQQQEAPDPALKGADFSADPSRRLGYMTQQQVWDFYGDRADYAWDKISEAAQEAARTVILWEGEPIAAAYHAISAGMTEGAENIWDGPLPYLQPVDSGWDVLAEDYKSTAVLAPGEIRQQAEAQGITLLPNDETWFEEEERSPSDYVTRIRLGDRTLTGNQLRQLLGLRSASFTIGRQGKNFIFYVRGYGHGAGLSQNGADYMARQGADYQEILRHYYTDVTLARLE